MDRRTDGRVTVIGCLSQCGVCRPRPSEDLGSCQSPSVPLCVACPGDRTGSSGGYRTPGAGGRFSKYLKSNKRTSFPLLGWRPEAGEWGNLWNNSNPRSMNVTVEQQLQCQGFLPRLKILFVVLRMFEKKAPDRWLSLHYRRQRRRQEDPGLSNPKHTA